MLLTIISSEDLLKPSNIQKLISTKCIKLGESLVCSTVFSRMHMYLPVFTVLIVPFYVVKAGPFTFGKQHLPAWMNVINTFFYWMSATEYEC